MTGHRAAGAPRRGGDEHLQGDLFTGEWQAECPKRGNGSHIRLKPVDGEKPIVPGMASYAGEGPAGTYCRDCAHYGVVAVQTGVDDVEITAPAARSTPSAATPLNHPPRHSAFPACKHFLAGDESKRHLSSIGRGFTASKISADLRRAGQRTVLPGQPATS